MRSRLTAGTILTALPLLAACGSETARAGSATMRDSAGIRIVENERPAWSEGQGWRVRETPQVDVGVVDGPPAYQLSQVRGAVRLSDGALVVANGQSNELRFFDRGGTHVRTVGKVGGGPGEFRMLDRLIRLPGDSVAAWDARLLRMSVFTPRGEFVRSVKVPPMPGMIPRVEGIFPDGSLLVTPFLNPAFAPGTVVARDTATYLRLSPAGEPIDTVGRFPGQQTIAIAGSAAGRFALRFNAPFGLTTLRAVQGDRLYVGNNEKYQIAVHEPGGGVRRLVRRSHRAHPVTREEIERYRQREREDDTSPADRPMLERRLAALRFPESKPAYQDMVVDADGAIWVREYPEVGDDNPLWTVFDPDGRLLGGVAVPEGVRVLEIGSDYLLGTWQDEVGVEHVRLYQIEK